MEPSLSIMLRKEENVTNLIQTSIPIGLVYACIHALVNDIDTYVKASRRDSCSNGHRLPPVHVRRFDIDIHALLTS